ncbi:hypothetical protein GCM10010168_69690 [Actinoplanes ianthinogenes]|uniref:Uncharacterized protein n=2 Tax=Actinoplanes ianthinogenes TaxID=122358 RepID=A0ABM7M0S7_9ACTN|nr:hypothetical protein Aiant_58250 [Actinoplanes ianthinogenes]GGR41026.1 hypothetical protein GCM10010168_69690 [Actinoplanes ianthinogenes]
MRERVFNEMTKRREHATAYRKALWGFSARVQAMRSLAHEAVALRESGKDFSSVRFDLVKAREGQELTRDAYAELESHASPDVQIPARACMEALTECFNHCASLRIKEADAAWAFFNQQHEVLALEINKESEHFNAIIYSAFTPIWRELLRRTIRKPLPYRAMPPPMPQRNPEERPSLEL